MIKGESLAFPFLFSGSTGATPCFYVIRLDGRVAMQRPAKPCTPVRLRLQPPSRDIQDSCYRGSCACNPVSPIKISAIFASTEKSTPRFLRMLAEWLICLYWMPCNPVSLSETSAFCIASVPNSEIPAHVSSVVDLPPLDAQPGCIHASQNFLSPYMQPSLPSRCFHDICIYGEINSETPAHVSSVVDLSFMDAQPGCIHASQNFLPPYMQPSLPSRCFHDICIYGEIKSETPAHVSSVVDLSPLDAQPRYLAGLCSDRLHPRKPKHPPLLHATQSPISMLPRYLHLRRNQLRESCACQVSG